MHGTTPTVRQSTSLGKRADDDTPDEPSRSRWFSTPIDISAITFSRHCSSKLAVVYIGLSLKKNNSGREWFVTAGTVCQAGAGPRGGAGAGVVKLGTETHSEVGGFAS